MSHPAIEEAPKRPMFSPLSGAKSGLFNLAGTLGKMGIVAAQIVRRLVRLEFDREELLRNMYKMGVKSVPIVILTALFTGATMVVQAAPIVQRYGAHQLLGWGAGFGILREVGPVLTALMISGRVGANNTAELGTMTVTEQIDALRALAIDPIAFLIVPRFVAIVVTLFLSTLYADAVALLGAAYAGQALVGVSPATFYNGLTSGYMGIADVANGLIKSLIFGVVMALASCHFGLAVTGGAPGVGRAVNATVVASAAGIFVVDYFVSFLLG
jgi:phospholipid/cholesterol/gamma-HCH transport system permease protein